VDAGADPLLVVPNRLDVEALERELLRTRGVLLGGAGGDLRRPVRGRAEAGAVSSARSRARCSAGF
jgi:hypothetical protein